MPLYRPSSMQKHLKALGAHPKKSLSQNFLIDGNILKKIIATAHVEKGDIIIEVGPGPGALTEALLKKGAHVVAIEKDHLFAQGLKKLQESSLKLEVIEGDFLELSLIKLLKNRSKRWKVVANLPYKITTPILAKLFLLSEYISSITVMVQKEVGQRMCAKPNTKDFSRLSLFTQFYSKPKLAFSVSPNSFSPKPKVTSCVMHLELTTPPKVSSKEGFFAFVSSIFQKKRKMIRTSLKNLYSIEQIESAFLALGIKEKARPQELSLTTWINLFEKLEKA